MMEPRIAVVGLACRLPGAHDKDAYWRLLTEGRSTLRTVPDGRWDLDALGYRDLGPRERACVQTGGFFERIDELDAEFFSISAREAQQMDPQQRLLLELASEAFESAGLSRGDLRGSRTAVFVGISTNDYLRLQLAEPRANSGYVHTGNVLAIAANRISYRFDLRGPSVSVDTACSSSLVAVHLACQALASGEASAALAGGVNVITAPELSVSFARSGFLSPDGCRSFAAGADGYIRGEGAVLLVLKRLDDALACGDDVWAVISGSAVNQDGESLGLTAPNGRAQAALIRAALQRAGRSPAEVSYLEAHGTGTVLGDRIEATALGEVFGDRAASSPLRVGSAKSNLGHLEAAAGAAGLAKIVLSLRHGQIPASIRCDSPNPDIPFEKLRLHVQRRTEPWPSGGPRVAGVSSFGFGGTNCHVVVEEAPPVSARDLPGAAPGHVHTLLLSARTEAALRGLAGRVADMAPPETAEELFDRCHTLAVRRTHHAEARLAVVGSTWDGLAGALRAFAAGADELENGFVGGRGPASSRGVPASSQETVAGVPTVMVAAETFARGVAVPWNIVYAGGRCVSMPTAPWSHRRYWFSDGLEASPLGRGASSGRLREIEVASAGDRREWEAEISPAGDPLLRDHRVQGVMVFPATGYVELCLRAFGFEPGRGGTELADIELLHAMLFADDEPRQARLVASLQPDGGWRFEILSRAPRKGEQWTVHVRGRATFEPQPWPASALPEEERARFMRRASHFSGEQHLSRLREHGNEYGPRFRGVRDVWHDAGEAMSEVELPAGFDRELAQYVFHPALLDAAAQVLLGTAPDLGAFMPVRIQRVRVRPPLPERLFCRAVRTHREGGRFGGDIWIHDASGREVAGLAGVEVVELASAGAAERGPADMVHRLSWVEAALKNTSEAGSLAGSGWLLLGSGGELPRALRAAMGELGAVAVTVEPGERLERVAADAFHARLDDPRDLGDVVAALRSEGIAVRGVVHLAGLGRRGEGDPASPAEAIARGAGTLLAAAQGIMREAADLRVIVVTRDAQRVVEDDRVGGVMQSALPGLGRTLQAENPGADVRLLDLAADLDDAVAARWISDEASASAPGEQAAIRRGARFVARLSCHERQIAMQARRAQVALDPGATYLITGGLGALGLALARWLAENGARRLVLLGRTPMPPRRAWGGSLSGSERGKVEAILACERLGASVRTMAIDVGDAAALSAALAALEEEGWPPIRGVLHAAGVLELRQLRELSPAELYSEHAGKIGGAWNLHVLFEDRPLDFFVLFSSLSAVVPSLRQGSYAMANAFLDGLAAHRRARGLPAVSIGWGALRGVGMAARHAAREGHAPSIDGMGIRLEHALQIQAVLLRDEVGYAAVVPIALAELRRIVRVPCPLLGDTPVEEPAARSRPGDVDLSAALERASGDEQRLDLLSDYLRATVGKALGEPPESLDTGESVLRLGLDSLVAIEVVDQIERRLGVKVPVVRMLEGPSIRELAGELLRDLARREEARPGLAARSIDLAEPLPLSVSQAGIWFLHQLAPDSHAYNVAFAFRLRGLDRDAFERSFAGCVARHPSLRTVFVDSAGDPRQRVLPEVPFRLEETDATHLRPHELRDLLTAASERPFDLETAPLFRLLLYRISGDQHCLLFVFHHTIIDFWSLVILVHEIGLSYEAHRRGGVPQLRAPRLTYADFVSWQHERLAGPDGERLLRYWRAHIEGASALLDLPTDFPRPAKQTFSGATWNFALSGAVSEGLKQVARDLGVTLYTALLAVFEVLMARLSGQPSFLVGTLATGRTMHGFEDVVGYFVNLTPVRAEVTPEEPFAAHAARVRDSVLGALEHQDYPFPLLVQHLSFERDGSRSPLCQVLFVLQKAQLDSEALGPFIFLEDGEQMDLGGLAVESMGLARRSSQFDLLLVMLDDRGRLRGQLQYNTDLFTAETVQRFAGYFERLVEAVVAAPAAPVGALDPLRPHEREELVRQAAAAPIPAERFAPTVLDGFEEAAGRWPDRIAVTCGGASFTYCELHARALRTARTLRRRGIGRGSLVAVHGERSLDLAVSLLGVMASGAAYLPLDPAYPGERLRQMARHARVDAVLRLGSAVAPLDLDQGRHWLLSDVMAEGEAISPSEERWERARAGDPAYVLFTSGSTGTPKAIRIAHGALMSHMRWMLAEFAFDETDVVLQKTPVGFDASVWELYAPLLSGGRLAFAAPRAERDPRLLLEEIDRHGATVLQVVPSLLRALLAAGGLERADKLRWVFSGGEALSGAVRDDFFRSSSARLVNLYGPTEATIDATFWRCERGEIESLVPIGRPVSGMAAYVVDAAGQLCPPGVPGELLLAGPQLADGYLFDPEETRRRFVPNPFGGPHGTAYRTGDRVRLRSDGVLLYLGRLDDQMKIRGVRLEPEEIEAALRSHPAVREAAVVLRGEGEWQQLTAFVVARSGGPPLDESTVREHAARLLPDAAVPARVVAVGELPSTPSGKVDRRALRSMPLPAVEAPRAAEPRSELEEEILRIWRELLGRQDIGPDDDFFDLGGHSLMAMAMVARLSELLGEEIWVSAVFETPTAAKLAARLGRAPSHAAPAVSIVPLREAASPRSLFLVHPTSSAGSAYRDLAAQVRGCAVFGVAAGGDHAQVASSIPDLAAAHVEAILRRAPEGPCAIGGWSIGGTLAYEVSRQLRERGRPVDLLVLIDSVPFHAVSLPMLDGAPALMEWFLDDVVRRGGGLDEGSRDLLRRAAAGHAAAPEGGGLGGLWQSFLQAKALIAAARAYRPGPVGCRTLLIVPEDGHTETRGWADFAGGPVDVERVAGDHYSVMRDPLVEAVAGHIDARWKREEPS